MKIAVTTPTGRIGSAVADQLLNLGGDIEVKLLGRRPHLMTALVRRGAETAVGTQDDAEYLGKALRGVDALFWVTPPGYGSDDVRSFQNRVGKAVALAIYRSRVPRVVNLSSIGAHLDSGTGIVCGLHDVERLLDTVCTHITHLRSGFFYENLLLQIDTIRVDGRFSFPLSGTRRCPMLAVQDIARFAVDQLTDTTWTGHQVRELHGPADLAFDDVARILSETLGRKITYVRCNGQQMRQMITFRGISDNMADLLMEMYEAIDSGRTQPEQPATVANTAATTLASFAHEVLLPRLNESLAK